MFIKQLVAILRIVFPSLTSKEVGLLLLHTFFLVTRTVLSVYVAHLDGRLVRDIVSADGKGFLRGLGWWFALAIPSSYTNSMVSLIFFPRNSYLNQATSQSYDICNLNYQFD